MEVKKINEINKGYSASVSCLLKKIDQLETRTGKSYCVIQVSDGEESIDAKIWNAQKESAGLVPGKVYDFQLQHQEYNGASSWVVESYSKERDDLSAKDFLEHAPIEGDVMWKEIVATVNNLPEDLRKICTLILGENQKMKYWSAAKSVHHSFYEGLLYHTYRMLLLAKKMVEVYPAVNKDVLFTAVILHDIGKVDEMEFDLTTGATAYTVDGQLFGHALIGIKKIWTAKAKLSLNDSESIRMVEHCIAAHHGQLDWGAITVPATVEAQLLHLIDMVDSRIEIFEEQGKNLEPGSMSDKVFSLGTGIYKPLS